MSRDIRKNPLVSVIMPLYNKQPYVRRAVESVKVQTYENWELIVVDDGSTDGSLDEVPREDERIRIFCQENRGPGAARNRGAKKASGEIVTFIDADDIYFPNKLSMDVKTLWKGRHANWLVSPFEHQVGGKVVTEFIRHRDGREVRDDIKVFVNPFECLTVAGWHIDGLSVRKDLFEQTGGFDEEMRCYEITELQIRLALTEPKVAVLGAPFYRVIDVPASAFKVSEHKLLGTRQMGERLNELARQYPDYSADLNHNSRASMLSYVAALILLGRGDEARRYLLDKYPHQHSKRWWKMWIGSWIPAEILKRVVGGSQNAVNV